MAKANYTSNHSFTKTCDILRDSTNKLGISNSVVDEERYQVENQNVLFMVFEKYYYRSNNMTSLSMLVIGDEYHSKVTLISSGGAQGWLFKISWGAEKSYINKVGNILISNGFKQID